MVVSIEAALPNAWVGEIQADLGPIASRSDGRVIVKDAQLRYTGLELSAGVRGSGLSVDAEFEHIESVAVDAFLSAGLYANGRAEIDRASIEAGYMLVPRRLEALAGFDAADARVFAEPVRRGSAGMTLYLSAHRVKVSVMHREVFNDRGVTHARSRATCVQTQFSF